MSSAVFPSTINRSSSAFTPSKHRWMAISFFERKALLLLFDLATINSLLAILLNWRGLFEFSSISLQQNAAYFIVISLLWIAVGILFGVYNLLTAASPMRSAWITASAGLITSLSFSLLPYISPPLPERRLEILLFVLLIPLLLAVWRICYAITVAQPSFSQRILIVGAGWSGQTLTNVLHGGLQNDDEAVFDKHIGYNVIGFVDDDTNKQDISINDIPVLSGNDRLVELTEQLKPDQVALCVTAPQDICSGLFDAILQVRTLGVPVVTMHALYEKITGRVPVEHVGHNLSIILKSSDSALERLYVILRRVLDIVIGLQGCFMLGLLIPFVWIMNRLYSPGPLFYTQQRTGQGGKPFNIIKFRSMIVDAEKASGAVWADEDDPRITRIGRILRLTRLDEIPQFINILRGEMSLIGPRPERPHFVHLLSEAIPFYQTRHSVKPGLTGWAQVCYRYGASENDARIKLEYDLFYIKHRGPFLDLKILLKTISVVIGFQGR